MRGALLILTILLMLISDTFSQGIKINDQVSLDLNLRYRKEIDDRDFDNDTGANEYNLLRSQVGFRMQVNDKIKVRIKFQDSRYMGTTGSNKESSSDIEMHESWMMYDKIFDSNFSFLVGRYELEHGRGRVLGADDWNHYGPRAYDGIKINWIDDDIKLSFFAAKIWDKGHHLMLSGYPYFTDFSWYENNHKWDWELFGFSGNMYNGLFQPLFYIDYDCYSYSAIDESGNFLGENTVKLIFATIGAYSKYSTDSFYMQGEFYYQGGDYSSEMEIYPDHKINAFLLAADVDYVFDSPIKPYIGIGFDITSGDDPDDGDQIKTFSSPYMSSHKFRGNMDYFTYNEVAGLDDFIMKLGINPDKYSVELVFHNFSYRTKEYSPNEESVDIGDEVDLRVQYELYQNLFFDGEFCLFFPGDVYQRSDVDNSKFINMSLIARF